MCEPCFSLSHQGGKAREQRREEKGEEGGKRNWRRDGEEELLKVGELKIPLKLW